MSRAPLVLTVMAGLASAHDAGFVADENADDVQALLDVHVVSGPSRTAERSDDAPATTTLVTHDQLRSLGLRTLHEAINFLSLGLVAQDPLHSVEVGARGVLLTGDYGNHVLVVVDGHPLNEAWGGTAYFEQGLALPVELIDRVEFIVGPGSVMYGSSAMLGVINVVTRRAEDLGRLRVTLEGALLPAQQANGDLRFTPGGLGATGRMALSTGWATTLLGHPFELVAAGEYFVHQGQQLEFTPQTGLVEGDGTSEWPQRWSSAGEPGTWGGATQRYSTCVANAWLTARWGDFRLLARYATYSRATPAYDIFGVAIDFDGRAAERDTFLDTELKWSRVVNDRLSISARGYFDHYRYLAAYQASSWLEFGDGELPAGADPSNFTFLQEIRAGSTWGGLETQATFDWTGDGRFPLQLGVDGRARAFHDATVTASPEGEVLGDSNHYDVTEWQVAVWLQQRARILPTLSLNAGARLDTQSAFAPNVAPRAAVVWTLPWAGRIKAVLSSAFRTPSGYERFAQYEGFQVRNPALVPEQVLTGELGYEQRFGPHRVAVIGFVSRFTNLIRLEPDADTELFSYQNAHGLLSGGAQALVEGHFGPFSYGATFTGAVNEIRSGPPLAASPSWFGNARASYAFSDAGPRASVLAHFSSARLISAAGATGVDANGDAVGWASEWSTPQIELRAVVEGQLKQVPGLWLRGVVGGNVMPASAYVVGPRQAPSEDFRAPSLAPNNRLFVLLTLGWSLD